MVGPVPAAVAWRELPDPHDAALTWRCRAFQFELRCSCQSCNLSATTELWRPESFYVVNDTPARRALKEYLFLNP